MNEFIHWGEEDNVYLTITEQTAFTANGIFITTPLVTIEKALIKIQAEIENHSFHGGQYSLRAAVFDKSETKPVTPDRGEKKEEVNLAL